MSDEQPDITPVMLAGGQGKRLRPLTGKRRPKPFLRPFSEHSLLQETVLRASHLSKPIVVCDDLYIRKAAKELLSVRVVPQWIIGEPVARSTAAAVGIAAFALKKKDGLMAVMPSDHYIEDEEAFNEALGLASREAMHSDGPVILGVRPQRAETRFGYIHAPDRQGAARKVKNFKEKPGSVKARKFFQSPDHFWNTGIFVVRPRVFLEMLNKYTPPIYDALESSYKEAVAEEIFLYPGALAYAKAPSVSVDCAVMEHAKTAQMVELETYWSDIGSWGSFVSMSLKKRVAA